MALVPIFPSREDLVYLREHNGFSRLRDTTDIEPGNDEDADQEFGSEDE